MKSTLTPVLKPSSKPARKASRIRAGENATSLRGVTPGRAATDPATARRLGVTTAPAPTQGAVRLDIAGSNSAALLALTLTIRDGLTGNLYYPGLTSNLAALSASYTGQHALADQIASLEQQLKTARFALDTENVNTRDILRSAARACEASDPTDEALVSVGWTLRRAPSRPIIPSSPGGLGVQNTPFPGEVRARWSRVPNARFYEVQAVVPADQNLTPDWNLVPIQSSTVAAMVFNGYTVGSLFHIRVRTVGSKGPSPWTDSVTAVIL
jgi:hypothetical protein